MHRITIGFMAYDIHELLCHLVARELGFYRDRGLQPRLIDATFLSERDVLDRDYVQVACGSAYLGRRRGVRMRVVLAGVHRPLFWLVSPPHVRDVHLLGGHSVATYPPAAPPHYLLNAVLRQGGLDPSRDVALVPGRDDTARLGLLRQGEVAAALVSSAALTAVLRRQDLVILAWLGANLTFVTSGLAASEDALVSSPDLIEAVVGVHRRGLGVVQTDEDATVAVIRDVTGATRDLARTTYQRIRGAYTPEGRVAEAALADGLARIEAEVGEGERVDATALYGLVTDL